MNNEYEAYKAKDRRRKRITSSAISSPEASSSPKPDSSFSTRQSLGKAAAKALRNLPKSPGKKRQVLTNLISNLSPNTKSHVFTSARRKVSLSVCCPCISEETKCQIIAFLERPDMSYCKPGRADTVYCGKDEK